ncbi:MAG: AEC family transporter [Pseudomonadota bacterium]
MQTAIITAALVPVILVIALGFFARVSGLVTAGHVSGVERVTYVILFPTLLFSNLSVATFEGTTVWLLAAAMVMAQIVISVFSWWLFIKQVRAGSIDGPAATSAFQGAIRFNTYIALAIVFALEGERGIQIASVPLAFIIITVNLFCVAILTRHGARPQDVPPPSMLRSIVTNPLIVACVAGLLINPFAIDWPMPVERVFDWFGAAAIALGLFAVGAGLKPISGQGSVRAIVWSNAIGLIAKPTLFIVLGLALALPGNMLAIGLMCMAAPTATSSFILARQLGGDAPLMAQITTIGTIGSAATISVWLGLLPFMAGP